MAAAAPDGGVAALLREALRREVAQCSQLDESGAEGGLARSETAAAHSATSSWHLSFG